MARKELDRFDTTAKRDVRISTKLTSLIGSAIIVCCFGIATIAVMVFERQIENNAKATLNDSAHGVEATLSKWIDMLKGYAVIFSDRSDVIEGIESKKVSILSSISRGKKKAIGVDLLAFTDKDGNVIVSTSFRLCNTNISGLAPVKTVLGGSSSAYSFEQIGEFSYAAIAAAPVRHDGAVIGSVVLCFDLTAEDSGSFVQTMKDFYSIECTLFKGNTRVSTTLTDYTGASLSGTTLHDESITRPVFSGQRYDGHVKINGTAYECVYLPVKSGDGRVSGMAFIAESLEVISMVRRNAVRIIFPIAILVTLAVGGFSLYFIRWLMWRINNVTKVLREMATGEADLTKRVKLLIRDEIGDLVIQFDFFCDKLQHIVSELKKSKDVLDTSGSTLSEGTDNTAGAITRIISNIDSIGGQMNRQVENVDSTANAIDEISQNITSLDSMIESQASGVAEASSAIDEMIGNIDSVNRSVEKMASSFDVLAEDSKTGFTKQQDVNERIKLIESQSELLQEANQAISSIAEQTNLLAMNAAIEAAHAGDAGKGFSVVADEIRKLSETSSVQSKTIGEQLNKIRESITEVVAASEESSAAFTSVSTRIQATDELVVQIRAAMEEQNAGSKRIGETLRIMNDSTQEVHNASKSMSARNERIMKEMYSLKDITLNMKRSMEEMSAGARKINETGAELGSISTEVRDSIEKIGSQIDLFKV